MNEVSDDKEVSAAYRPPIKPDQVQDTPRWYASIDELVAVGIDVHSLDPTSLKKRPMLGVEYHAEREDSKQYKISQRIMKAIERMNEQDGSEVSFP